MSTSQVFISAVCMFDPLHKWFGIPASEQPPDHYRLLGIVRYESDSEVIDAAADKQLTFLHDLTQGEHAEAAEQLSNLVSAARLCLLNPDKKRLHDESLRRTETAAANSPTTVSPAVAAANPLTPKPVAAVQVRTRSPKHRATKKRGLGVSPFHITTFLSLVALVLIGIGIYQGRLKLDLSRLSRLGITSEPAQPEREVPTRPPSTGGAQPASSIQRPASSQTQRGAPQRGAGPSSPSSASPSAQSSAGNNTANPPPPSVAERSFADLAAANVKASQPPVADKSALPAADELESKMALVRELYETKYREAVTTAQKIALAQAMHRDGQETDDDPGGRFAVWRVARDIFIHEGQFAPALGIVDNLDTHYRDVDSAALKAETLRASAEFIDRTQIADFVDAVLAVAKQLQQQEQFELATELCEFCQQKFSTQVRSSQLEQLQQLQREIESVHDAYQDYLAAQTKLTAGASDPALHQAVGEYLCLIRGDWAEGLPHLAQGTPGPAKAAADQQWQLMHSGTPPTTDASIAVADAWFDAGQAESQPHAKGRILQHAFDWYQRSRERASGLALKKIEQRIADLEPLLGEYAPPEQVAASTTEPTKLLQTATRTSPESRSDFAYVRGNDITVGMGSRPDGRGEAMVGMELNGVKKITVVGSASHAQLLEIDVYSKSGFVVDYHTPGGFAKRVYLGLGLRPGRLFNTAPPWGTEGEPDMITDLGRSASYQIDLARWAPSTWDGRCWFTLHMQNAGADRALKASVSWEQD